MRNVLHLLQNPLGDWGQAFLRELSLWDHVSFSTGAFEVHQDFQRWLAQVGIARLAEVCSVALCQQGVYLVLVHFIAPFSTVFIVSAFWVSSNADVR